MTKVDILTNLTTLWQSLTIEWTAWQSWHQLRFQKRTSTIQFLSVTQTLKRSQNSKLVIKFALGARLTLFIEVTRYSSLKNCSQLRQYQQTTPQLILSKTATVKLYKENFTNLNSNWCDSLQLDFVKDGQTVNKCWAFKLQPRIHHESHFECFHGDFSRKHIVQFYDSFTDTNSSFGRMAGGSPGNCLAQ